ncbi:MAG: hypothetical protein IJ057_13220, partial [Bacteroidales bacterium]|nr:hypothetical protein [Bacteroidales bacterium]
MKKYIDPENERYRFYVRETLNVYSLQVLVVDLDENIPITPQVAARLQISLPKSYRLQSCTREAAEQQLDELAALNGWAPVDTQD